LEDRSIGLESLAQLGEVHQVAIVRDGDSTSCIFHHKGLAILDRRGTGGRISIMADGAGAFELAQHVLVEDVRDQPHPAMRDERLAVGRHDTGGLLPAMLQAVEPEVREVGGLRMPVDAEHPALLVETVEVGLLCVEDHFQL
jgi:hypothetical protein